MRKRSNEIVKYWFGHHNPSFLAKDGNQDKVEQVVNLDHHTLVDLRNNVNKKKIPKAISLKKSLTLISSKNDSKY